MFKPWYKKNVQTTDKQNVVILGRNANSVAFGTFYRPNEDTMFSLGTNFGNGENMFNAGLSFKIGQGSGVTTSRTAMAKKIAELEALVKEQGELIRQYASKK